MKLHSDILTESDIRDALTRAKATGHVDRLVHFDLLETKGSRTRKNGFEIHLEWIGTKVKGDGRRWTNTGKRGADTNGMYAATYDEWGWFIAELFDADKDLVFGHYKSKDVFESRTKFAYGL